MTRPSQQELDEFINALQLSIKTKIAGVKLMSDNAIQIRFSSSTAKDAHLITFAKLVGGELTRDGTILHIDRRATIDIAKLTSFLFVTRLTDENIAAIRRMGTQYDFLGTTSGPAQVAIDSPTMAANYIFSVVEEKRMTLRTLAEKTGLTQTAISKFKAGGDIRLSNLIKIARALGLMITFS